MALDSELVRSVYNEQLNYQIIQGETPESNCCAIYFTSHGLYYPNTEAAFEYSVIKKNYYEWLYCKVPGIAQHIFVRDVFKQWYLKGINKDINTIDKLACFLQELLEGKKCICVGTSAGGYAAALFGALLNAERIFIFNAQFTLGEALGKGPMVNPIVYQKKDDPTVNQYYNIIPFLNKYNRSIYYFVSLYSKSDLHQIQIAKTTPVLKIIGFKVKKHGIPFFQFNLEPIFRMSLQQLEKLSESEPYSKWNFSIRVSGWWNTLGAISSKICAKASKRRHGRDE